MKYWTIPILLAMLPALQTSKIKHKYTGPKCLSGFCIEGGSKQKLATIFGKNPKNKAFYCYMTKESNVFVQYVIEDEFKLKANIITWGSLAITDFDNCGGRSVMTSASATELKTGEGIGIGSTEAEVIHAYGKPVEREAVTPKDVQNTANSMFVGPTIQHKKISGNIGDTILSYKSDFDDLSFTWILLRKGRVSGIRTALQE